MCIQFRIGKPAGRSTAHTKWDFLYAQKDLKAVKMIVMQAVKRQVIQFSGVLALLTIGLGFFSALSRKRADFKRW